MFAALPRVYVLRVVAGVMLTREVLFTLLRRCCRRRCRHYQRCPAADADAIIIAMMSDNRRQRARCRYQPSPLPARRYKARHATLCRCLLPAAADIDSQRHDALALRLC